VENTILGIDVGGTNTKGAIVNLETGKLMSEKIKIPTPNGATPDGISAVARDIVDSLNYQGNHIGIGFPSIIHKGICRSDSNISDKWIGMNLNTHFSEVLGFPSYCINDADAAGIAESQFGNAKDIMGTVILLTIGTGIGSALFYNGTLIPNTEFGRLYFKNGILEQYASNRTRKVQELSMDDWSSRLNEVLLHIEFIFSPDLLILGGGISQQLENYQHHLKTNTQIIPAGFRNNAGIVGAAKYADQKTSNKKRADNISALGL